MQSLVAAKRSRNVEFIETGSQHVLLIIPVKKHLEFVVKLVIIATFTLLHISSRYHLLYQWCHHDNSFVGVGVGVVVVFVILGMGLSHL